MIELLAPAGSADSLRAAVNAGADAVYIGGSMFGARAYADNPDEKALIDGIEFCHLHGRKLYMTVNTLLKERELEHQLYDYLFPYYEGGVDGLIVQDLGVMRFVREEFPGLEVHASTQMTITGSDGARLLQREGITRVVPARELSLEEIRIIIEETGIEVETFIHGAMCYCYSGQCLMSSMIGGRSGNRGRCAQPCRLPYTVAGAKSRAASYMLSMKDMCTLDILPELIDCQIASLKIEGRMKRPEYTAGVVSVYRKYIDLYQKAGKKKYRIEEEDRKILMDLYNRGGFSQGYYFMHNGTEMMSMVRPNHLGTEALKVKSIANGKIKAAAMEDLHKKDVLEISRGNEIVLPENMPKGSSLTLQLGASCRDMHPGRVIYRTKNECLLNELSDKFLRTNVKEKIKGDLRIFADSPAILKLSFYNISVTVSGMVAEPAKNSPSSRETVEKQLRKTGNTPFVFEKLKIDMEEGLFVQVRQLNELRRNAINRLTAEILKRSRRTEQDMEALKEPDRREQDSGLDENLNIETDGKRNFTSDGNQDIRPGGKQNGQPCCGGKCSRDWKLNILVTSAEQFLAVCDSLPQQTDTIYFDLLLFGQGRTEARKKNTEKMAEDRTYEEICKKMGRLQNRGIRCVLNFPPVLRSKERTVLAYLESASLLKKMDGFLLHTVDELAWIQKFSERAEKTFLLVADENFYAYNRRAACYLKEQGIGRITLPAELNARELTALDTRGTELNIYGYQPLMHSAQCILKNTEGCTGTPKIVRIRDRKNAEFPVLNRCSICCNTIYNSVPLQLGDCLKEAAHLSVESVRLSFTIESVSETKQILQQYKTLLYSEEKTVWMEPGGTRGHFRRGVE